jgi:hypothetical protein
MFLGSLLSQHAKAEGFDVRVGVLCCGHDRLAIRWSAPFHPPMLHQDPRGTASHCCDTHGLGIWSAGPGFGGMFHPALDESARKAGSTPITGQPSNSFQDSLPFRSPFALFSLKKYTR